MEKKAIVRKVIKKMALNQELQKVVNVLLKLSETLDGDSFVVKLKHIIQEEGLSDDDFAKIVASLIERYDLSTKDESYKTALKSLVSKPPLKELLKGLYF